MILGYLIFGIQFQNHCLVGETKDQIGREQSTEYN